MRVNTYTVEDDGTLSLHCANVELAECFPGPENDDEFYDAACVLIRGEVYHGGGGASQEFAIKAIGFVPLRPLRAPDDGTPYYVTPMDSIGNPRVDYGDSDWPSRSYMLVLA